MTENNKLRALLAEAHSFVDPVEGDLFDRIHAALAEPVVRCGECNGDLTESRPGRHQCDTCDAQRVIAELTKERDEARAEVERLKIILDAVRAARSLLGQLRDHVSDHACEELLSLLSDEPLDVDGNLYLTPRQAAYQRGAEAMREATVKFIRTTGWDMNPQVACTVSVLPIPGDK